MARSSARQSNADRGRSNGIRTRTNVQDKRRLQKADDHGSREPNDTDRVVWELRQSGIPGAQIAAMFGVTKHAIYHRLEKFPEYRVLRQREHAERAAIESEITNQLAMGLSTNDIIDLHGWTRAKLDSWLHRRGISLSRSHFTFDEEEAWAAFKDGASTHTLANRYGVYRIAIVRSFERKHYREYKLITSQRKGGRKTGHRIGNKFNVAKAYLDYKAGESIYDIGKRYRITPGTVSAAFRSHYGDEYIQLAKVRLTEHRLSGARWHPTRRSSHRAK